MVKKNIGLVILIVVFVISAGCIGNETERQTQKPLTIEEIKSNSTSISYDELMRNNENYTGKIVWYRGKIVQVTDGYEKTYGLRIATKPEVRTRYSSEDIQIDYFDDIIWVEYAGKRMLDGDIVDVWGKVAGRMRYKAVLGNIITIPAIDSLHLELVKKVGEQ